MGSSGLHGRFSRPIFWAAGLILLVAAFFFPAVRMPPSTASSGLGGSQSVDFSGWECAYLTPIFTLRLLQFTVDPHRFQQDAPVGAELPLLALSGWVNPLLLFYLLSCVVRKLLRFRSFIAGLIVLALVATWIFLAKEHFTLLLGHYLWVMGIFFTLAAPLLGRRPAGTDSGVDE